MWLCVQVVLVSRYWTSLFIIFVLLSYWLVFPFEVRHSLFICLYNYGENLRTATKYSCLLKMGCGLPLLMYPLPRQHPILASPCHSRGGFKLSG